jgi:hypothetical protein
MMNEIGRVQSHMISVDANRRVVDFAVVGDDSTKQLTFAIDNADQSGVDKAKDNLLHCLPEPNNIEIEHIILMQLNRRRRSSLWTAHPTSTVQSGHLQEQNEGLQDFLPREIEAAATAAGYY